MTDRRLFGQINVCHDPLVIGAEQRIIDEIRCHRPDLALAESQALFNNASIPIGERIAAAKDIERNTRGCPDHLVVRPIQYNDGACITKSEQVSLVDKVTDYYGRLQDQVVTVANLPYEKVAVQRGYGSGYYGHYYGNSGQYGGYGAYGRQGLFGTALGTGLGMYEQHREQRRREHEQQLMQQQQELLRLKRGY